MPDDTFLPLPKLATEPFLKLWEQEILALLLAEGKITEDVVANMRSWKHSDCRGQRQLSRLSFHSLRVIFNSELHNRSVMELVRGIKITTYCDEHKLTTAQRLNLFIKVCHAVQHAHQKKGVIHRALKPSNILLAMHDGDPVPKVIDFGIVKATQQELTDKTVYTQLNQFVGTPSYMSPEQAEMSGLDIDTRSDVYGLGVCCTRC